MPQYEQLHLLPRLGLARELSDRLYGNYPRRFRELVSNAVDACASLFSNLGDSQGRVGLDQQTDL